MINIITKIDKHSAVCACSRCSTDYVVKDKYQAMKSTVGDLCTTCKTMISSMKIPTQDLLKKVFTYDEVLGDLRYRHTTLSGLQGELATYSHSSGYLSVCVGKKQLLAHRVIYMMMVGKWPEHIDHINHIKHDNRWDNLRNITQDVNNRNMPQQINTTTGVIGVSLHKPTGKYRAYISVDSKAKHLGLFETVEAATAAREAANIQYGYHSNHGK